MSKEIKHESTIDPVCPHCGRAMSDAWELNMGDGDSATVDCGWCGEEYVVHKTVYVSYTTEKKP